MRAASLILGLLLAGPAFAQAPRCVVPDYVTIRDEGMGVAVVTYHNSADGCSNGVNPYLVSPNGITVRVIIDVNADPDAELENIRVLPQDTGYSAYPPELDVKDGETVEIMVLTGLS